MAMSRKHYKEFASVIADELYKYPDDIDEDIRVSIRSIAYAMCGVFKADNYNFDREKFLDAAIGQKRT